MPALARHKIVNTDEAGYYHCINRCVRRAFLCGKDQATGSNFDYRKQWFIDRLEHLKTIFQIDIGAYAIMSNHLHLNLKNRPDLVAQIDDEGVLRRWWRLFPPKFQNDNFEIPPAILELWLNNREFIEKIRSRLSSISWFMKSLCEHIARKANREESVTGRFWEGRFKCQKIFDQPSVIRVNAYIDLNPIRAKVADSLENSEFASISARLEAHTNPEVSRVKFLARFDAAEQELAQASSFLGLSEKQYLDVVISYANAILHPKEDVQENDFRDEMLHTKSFSHAIGSKASMMARAKILGKKWLKGMSILK